MASGLPVVVTDHVGASEVLSSGVNGFVVPAGDRGALAGVVRRLGQDAELRARVGMEAREHVVGSYSWAQYGDMVLDHVLAGLDVFRLSQPANQGLRT